MPGDVAFPVSVSASFVATCAPPQCNAEPVMSPCPWCAEPVLDPCNFASDGTEPGMWGVHTCPHCRGTFILWESSDESVTLDGVTQPI